MANEKNGCAARSRGPGATSHAASVINNATPTSGTLARAHNPGPMRPSASR